MTDERLKNLEYDLDMCFTHEFHISVHDLMNMLFKEDIPELIKFAKKANELFKEDMKDVSNGYMNGYKDCFNDLKKELYESKTKVDNPSWLSRIYKKYFCRKRYNS